VKGKKHNSYITHFDFSADGAFLQSNCGAYELLFWDLSSEASSQELVQIPSARKLRDVNWHTWTCTLGWPVQGIWPPCSDGTDINAVHRNHAGHLLATADDFGKVKVFRYPCVSKSSEYTELSGHSSHVTNVRWMMGDGMLVSTGGNDKSVMLWKVKAN
jgi:microtubule-associated protein-like 6